MATLTENPKGVISSVKRRIGKGWIMGLEIHEINAGSPLPWLMAESGMGFWRLNKVALIYGERRVPCWRCGFPNVQSGLFLELGGRNEYHCRIVAWSVADSIGLLSQAFLDTLNAGYCVRRRYSKTMGCEYLATCCPKCGCIQGDNFIYRNFKGRGGVFSNPADTSRLTAHMLPSFTDTDPRRFDWAFDGFTLEAEPRRIWFKAPFVLPNQAWPWTGR